MTRYRLRAVLLVFLLLNLTACTSWRSVTTQSPGQFIELLQPDRVRVTMPGGIQMELERPVVDDDQLVGRSIENERVGGAITQTFVATDSALEAARSLSSALGIDLSVPTSGEPVSGQTKSKF